MKIKGADARQTRYTYRTRCKARFIRSDQRGVLSSRFAFSPGIRRSCRAARVHVSRAPVPRCVLYSPSTAPPPLPLSPHGSLCNVVTWLVLGRRRKLVAFLLTTVRAPAVGYTPLYSRGIGIPAGFEIIASTR